MALLGTCDCGAVTLEVPEAPNEINACPCGWCVRIGARWGYYRRASLEVTGATDLYLRASERIEFHRCRVCGVPTHWQPNTRLDRVGVNMANFPATELAGVRVVVQD